MDRFTSRNRVKTKSLRDRHAAPLRSAVWLSLAGSLTTADLQTASTANFHLLTNKKTDQAISHSHPVVRRPSSCAVHRPTSRLVPVRQNAGILNRWKGRCWGRRSVDPGQSPRKPSLLHVCIGQMAARSRHISRALSKSWKAMAF
jgi:hypothetical protein